jgi:hypothetical protein
VIPLTEDGVRASVAGATAQFATSFSASVRRYIRLGLVQLDKQRWPSGGLTSMYVYEFRCEPLPSLGNLGPLHSSADAAAATDLTHQLVTIGSTDVVRETYHLVEDGSTVAFHIYAWIDSGHVWKISSRTDGAGDPQPSIEAALAML